MSTKFFTNAEENTLLKKLEGIFQHMQVYHFDALVGYFRASGYFRVQDFVRRTEKVRILVGIEVDKHTSDAMRKGFQFGLHNSDVIDDALAALTKDIQSAAYSKEIEDGMVRFIQDIANGKVELRAHPAKNLHAKIYIFRQEHEHEHAGWGSVITGSSNLTESGLERNLEFNVELRDHDDVKFALQTFEQLWADGVEITPPKVEAVRKDTFLNDEFTPYEIYIKFLIEYFGKSIEYDENSWHDLPANYSRLQYQIDAVTDGYKRLMKFNGFFLADVVGLGKTVVATMIAKKFIVHNGLLTKILIVHPPALKRNWEDTIRDFKLQFHVDYVRCGSVHHIKHPEDYDLIIVDEAHKFRTDTTDMYRDLQVLCKSHRRNHGPGGDLAKKVMLISATPLNNRPEDIKNLVLLFQDGRNATIDEVSSITTFFRPHIDMFNKMRDEPNRAHALKVIKRLYEEIRHKIIEPLTVRRTRTDLIDNEEYLKDIQSQGMTFPKMTAPQPIYYKLDPELNELFEDTMKQLRDKHLGLKYYRYQAIKFLMEQFKKRYDRADSISDRLTNIMRTQLVKRLDSSFFAFIESLKRFRVANQAMVTMFAQGRVHIAPNLHVSEYIANGQEEELIKLMDDLKETDLSIQTFVPDDFGHNFLPGLKHDQEIIDALCERWLAWQARSEDPKLVEFVSQLKGAMLHPAKNTTNKLVVFSEYKDTTDYLKRELDKAGIPRVLTVDSRNVAEKAEEVRSNFDARASAKEWKDDVDVLITTEVLAEGVNLHRSHTILNYDVPWNSTRLMQRIGRVNRIGTTAKEIHVYNFYPTEQTENQIELYKKALLKLQGFHTALGEDSQIYSSEEEFGNFGLFDKVKEDRDERVGLLMNLRAFRKAHPDWFKQIERYPDRARVGRMERIAAKSSVAFLKNPRRFAFYHVTADNAVQELTFLECAKLLAAEPSEVGVPLPAHHHPQLLSAIAHYTETQRADRDAVNHAERYGPNERKALSLLSAIHDLRLLNKEEEDLIARGKQALVDGKFQHLQRDLNKLRRNQDKEPVSPALLSSAALRILQKYPLDANRNGNGQVKAAATYYEEPTIIISETFA